VAQGEPLPLTQDQVAFTGHAVEVRLCAEDENFTPHTGAVQHFREPGGVRFDHALFEGQVVSPHYDSMLGKLVAHAATRDQAIDQLVAALGRTEVLGLPTNRGFLAACLANPVFRAGQALIPFLAEQGESLRGLLQKEELIVLVPSGLAAIFANNSRAGLPCPFPRPLRLRHRAKSLDWRVRELGHGELEVEVGGEVVRMGQTLQRVSVVRLKETAGQPGVHWHVQMGGVDLFLEDATFEATASGGTAAAQELRAPFNGKVIAVHVAAGQAVKRGDTLLVIESMKLEHAVNAPHDAVLVAVLAEVGRQTSPGQVLLRFAS
jgi:geranyl-CoA carboxylase alpha subunit